MTRTYVVMEVSRETHEEIRKLLTDAHYDHAIHRDHAIDEDLLDMHGIALKIRNADRPLSRSVVDNDQQRDKEEKE